MYKIKRICFDGKLGLTPYEDNVDQTFTTYDEAWSFANTLAKEEAKDLSESDENNTKAIIIDDKQYDNKQMIKVEYDTDIVTHYYVISCD